MSHHHKWVKGHQGHSFCEVCRIFKGSWEDETCPGFRLFDTEIGDEMGDDLISVAEVKSLRYENDYLRNFIALSNLDCVYCKLPKAKMGECQMTPHCSRADDIACTNFGRYEGK